LLNDQVNVFWIDAGLIDGAVIFGSLQLGDVIVVFGLLVSTGLQGSSTSTCRGELLSSGELSLRVHVLDLMNIA
jgi:hypothetical protein